MESFEDAIRELTVLFLRDGKERVDLMNRFVQKLEADPGDKESLSELKRRFHGFAGSGTTYGFPLVTTLGSRGEREIDTVEKSGAPVALGDVARWKELVIEIANALGGTESGATVSGSSGLTAQAPPDILVVDDDPAVLGLLQKTLEAEGLRVRCASSRREADEQVARRVPDGIVVDIVLSDGSGYALVEAVRAKPGGETIPILMISFLHDFLDKVEAIHCGADGYFEKPLDWEALVKRLRLLLLRNHQDVGKVLVVEDDLAQAGFVRAVLESAGYEVRVCAEPRAFETELVSFGPDLVTMDILLPGVSGYDLVRFVRQSSRYATLPVIYLTTQVEIDARVEAARSGGDEHLAKPVQPNLLLSVVAARIERARFLTSLLERDGLTNLLTHTAFLERVKVAMSLRGRGETRSAILVMLDLDHFKKVNDLYGHPVGDRVIVSLATLLRRRLRQSSTIGRYGGEEFAILLEGLEEAEVVRLLERLQSEFAAVTQYAGDRRFVVTFSAGFAFLEPTQTLDEWKDASDRALYAAKAQGRNRVSIAMRPKP